MSEPTPEKKDAPASFAPALGELFELALSALVNAPGVFTKLESRPTPGPGTSFLAALAWGAAFFALNLIHIALSSPAALQAYSAWQIGAVATLALGVWIGIFLLAASAIYAIARMLGGSGDFDRALLAAAITLTAAPLQALCGWFPMAWIAPPIVAAWIASCGLSSLFKTDPWGARGVCAVLAAGMLAVQYGAGLVVEKYTSAAQLALLAAQAVPAANQMAELQQQMQQVQAISEQAQQNVQNAKPGQSSLDLLRGPGGEEIAPAGPSQAQQLAQMSAQGDALNKSVISMLDSIAPMLNNPAITQSMTLQQKSDYAELKATMQEIRTSMATNKIATSQEHQAKMMKVQQLLMRIMSSGMTMPKPPPAPAPGEKK